MTPSGTLSRVLVRAPATSANLGPGFDAFGLALELYDEVEVTADFGGSSGSGAALEIEVDGEGAATVPRDERHLIVRAMREVFADLGKQPSALRLRCRNAIPQGRGLGSSAAAIVTGVAAARALAGEPLDRSTTGLAEATWLEGHPDNVAACLLGGLTIAWSDDGVRVTQVGVHPDVMPVVCIPAGEVSTTTARGLLPATVPHAEAAANAARAALLVEAVSRRPGLLFDATEDWLHQRYREPAMPDTIALVHALRKHRHPAVVSGAGPSVLVLADLSQVPSVSALATGWDVRVVPVNAGGVVVERPPADGR